MIAWFWILDKSQKKSKLSLVDITKGIFGGAPETNLGRIPEKKQ